MSQTRTPSPQALLAEIAALRKEIIALRQEKAELDLLIEFTIEHSDIVEGELYDAVQATRRESAEQFELLANTVPVPIVVSRLADDAILYANASACEFVRLPSADLKGHSVAELYRDARERKRLLATLGTNGYVSNWEIQGTRGDGAPFWAVVFARPLTFDAEPCCLEAYYDLTAYKQAEEALKESEARYRSLFDGMPVGLFRTTPEGQFIDANPALIDILGYADREALLATSVAELYLDPEGRRSLQVTMEREGPVRNVEGQGRRQDGTVVWVQISAHAVRDSEGRVSYYEGALEDITERKRAEQARRAAERSALAAQAADEAKSAFLAHISHELRTPLSVILSSIQLMARDPTLPAAQHAHLETINRSGEHLLALIDSVLELSKIEAGQGRLEETCFDLYRFLGDLLELFQARAARKGLELTFERAPSVPRYVKTDERKLRQVLLNLLGNAVKFTEQGGVTLHVSAPILPASTQEHTEHGTRNTQHRKASSQRTPRHEVRPKARDAIRSMLSFQITDTGCGIAPEELGRLFEAFTQTESGRKTQEGCGLGLALSQQFARLMGGEVTVSSQVGQGSTFNFDVRVALPSQAEIAHLEPKVAPRRVAGLEPGQPSYRVLVVDDRPESRNVLCALLRKVGFDVREALDGQQGLELYHHWQPDLVWMDIRMPEMDGYEATRRIKAAKERETVVIALTASAFEEDQAMAVSAGCDDFVRKPFRIEDILEKMAQHLGVRYTYAQGPSQPAGRDRGDAALPRLAPADLADLPADWVNDLRRAAAQAYARPVLALISRIEAEHPRLAGDLTALVEAFRFDELLAWTEQSS